jgi:hypothetical protein
MRCTTTRSTSNSAGGEALPSGGEALTFKVRTSPACPACLERSRGETVEGSAPKGRS